MALSLQIVAIDDEAIINFVSQKIVEMCGSRVHFKSFTRAEEALEYLKQTLQDHTYDRTLVLLDLIMPDKNGWELLNEIDKLNLPPDSPLYIYILSVMMIKSEIKRSLDHPFVREFVDKPLTAKKLSAILAAHYA